MAARDRTLVYINLTAADASFADYWFFVEDLAKREVLAVALAAVTSRRRVSATIETPRPNNDPYTQIYRLYLRSS